MIENDWDNMPSDYDINIGLALLLSLNSSPFIFFQFLLIFLGSKRNNKLNFF